VLRLKQHQDSVVLANQTNCFATFLIFFKDPVAVHDRVKYEGTWIECKETVKKDPYGLYCGCGYLGCTGYSRCTTNAMVCDLLRDVNEINFNDMKRGRDCKCRWI